jgi:hypothetical protein
MSKNPSPDPQHCFVGEQKVKNDERYRVFPPEEQVGRDLLITY